MSESLPTDGAQHLRGLARDHRRAHGKVYTPRHLAEFVLDQALGCEGAPDGAVLDPACGAGVFLVATVSRIAEAVTRLGLDVQTDGRRKFLREVKDKVWGLDLDPIAVALARADLRASVERLSPGPLASDFLDSNVVVGDFLRDSLNSRIPIRPQLIVGNPPYVTTDRISPEAKKAFRRAYKAAFGRIDLYTLFMEQSVRVLDRDGVWAFITPDKYLTSESARPIRELLIASGAIRSLARFESHRVFQDAAIVPCVTVWQARVPAPSHLTVSRVTLSTDEVQTPRIEESRQVPSAQLVNRGWSFQRRANDSLARRIVAGHPELRRRTSRISAGLTTGYNPAFVLSESLTSQLEPELVHRTLRGRDVLAYEIRDRSEYMLVPYVWAPDGSSRLIDLDDYPNTRRWLEQHRERLTLRHCVRAWGKQWWDLHDPVGEPLHRVPKIVVPDVARSNRFAADPGFYVPQHSAYYLLPQGIDPEVLAAILNSPPIEFLVRTQAPLVKDGFSRYRSQFLKTLPIPEVDQNTQRHIRKAIAEQRHDDLVGLTTGLFDVGVEEVQRALRMLRNCRSGGPGATTRVG